MNKENDNKYESVLKYDPVCCHEIMKNYRHTLFNLRETIVFIWLKNEKSFWYFIKQTNNNTLEGYIKGKNGWIYRPIKIKNIASYY